MTSSVASSCSTARRASSTVTSVECQPPPGRLQPVGQGAPGAGHDLEDVEAVGQRFVEVGVHAHGVHHVGQRDLEVLGLAGAPGRRGSRVGDPWVWVEARGVGHRNPRAEHRPLERPAEVPVAGEPQPSSFGVAQAQPLDGRGLLLGLFTHDG